MNTAFRRRLPLGLSQEEIEDQQAELVTAALASINADVFSEAIADLIDSTHGAKLLAAIRDYDQPMIGFYLIDLLEHYLRPRAKPQLVDWLNNQLEQRATEEI